MTSSGSALVDALVSWEPYLPTEPGLRVSAGRLADRGGRQRQAESMSPFMADQALASEHGILGHQIP